MVLHNITYYIHQILNDVQILETEFNYTNAWIGEGISSPSKENQVYDDIVMVAGSNSVKERLLHDYKNYGLDKLLKKDRIESNNNRNRSYNNKAESASLRPLKDCRLSKLGTI